MTAIITLGSVAVVLLALLVQAWDWWRTRTRLRTIRKDGWAYQDHQRPTRAEVLARIHADAVRQRERIIADHAGTVTAWQRRDEK